jgi:hypothetical protein
VGGAGKRSSNRGFSLHLSNDYCRIFLKGGIMIGDRDHMKRTIEESVSQVLVDSRNIDLGFSPKPEDSQEYPLFQLSYEAANEIALALTVAILSHDPYDELSMLENFSLTGGVVQRANSREELVLLVMQELEEALDDSLF